MPKKQFNITIEESVIEQVEEMLNTLNDDIRYRKLSLGDLVSHLILTGLYRSKPENIRRDMFTDKKGDLSATRSKSHRKNHIRITTDNPNVGNENNRKNEFAITHNHKGWAVGILENSDPVSIDTEIAVIELHDRFIETQRRLNLFVPTSLSKFFKTNFGSVPPGLAKFRSQKKLPEPGPDRDKFLQIMNDFVNLK